MAVFYLAKQGYGSVADILDWDTPRFLDAIEYEQISGAVERYHYEQAKRGYGN